MLFTPPDNTAESMIGLFGSTHGSQPASSAPSTIRTPPALHTPGNLHNSGHPNNPGLHSIRSIHPPGNLHTPGSLHTPGNLHTPGTLLTPGNLHPHRPMHPMHSANKPYRKSHPLPPQLSMGNISGMRPTASSQRPLHMSTPMSSNSANPSNIKVRCVRSVLDVMPTP